VKPQPAGSIVKLRYNFWRGPEPVAGNYLRTQRGRIYEIMRVQGKLLVCRVMARDEPVKYPARIFTWEWSPRTKRGRRGFSPLLD
jgi:hypothetical protein